VERRRMGMGRLSRFYQEVSGMASRIAWDEVALAASAVALFVLAMCAESLIDMALRAVGL